MTYDRNGRSKLPFFSLTGKRVRIRTKEGRILDRQPESVSFRMKRKAAADLPGKGQKSL